MITPEQSPFYNSRNSGDISQVANLKNLWDLSDSFTLEWSVYGTRGANQYDSHSQAYGSDLIIKWRPVEGGKYHSFIFANEYIKGDIKGINTSDPTTGDPLKKGRYLGGIASWVQYQFAERWWIQGRGEYEGLQRSSTLPVKTKQSILLGFAPSEFSGFRLQGDHQMTDGLPKEYRVAFQWNITIGAHPAHSY